MEQLIFVLGNLDTDGALNTSKVISGNAKALFSGNIDDVATSTGSQFFLQQIMIVQLKEYVYHQREILN